ncbi:unnamed protein product [Closterium sp. NIES-54]
MRRQETGATHLPQQRSDADDALTVVHIDLCRPFRVVAKDGSLNFLLLKDHKTRYVWVRLVAKKFDVLQEFEKWLLVAERQTKKSVLMLRYDRVGGFLGKQLTDFVDGGGIVHDLTCPFTPQQNGMAEREMQTVVESVQATLLHMGVQHHRWHIALRQDVWVDQPGPRRSGQLRRPPEWLTYHVCLPLAAFTTLYEDADADIDLPELDPEVHTDPEHCWDIATMTVREALTSWKGKGQ